MLSLIVGWLIKNLSGGIIDKALDAFTKTEDIRIRGKEIDSQTVRDAMKYYVDSQRDQNETQKAKFQFPIYWIMIGAFIFPLAAWWIAIILDSMFQFEWNIANLPTQELRDYAGSMIQFLFYTGGTVLGIKALLK